ELLVATGATDGAYTDAMIRTVEQHGPYIVLAPGFALAHSRPDESVHRTELSFVRLAEPVAFGHAANDPGTLVMALAAAVSCAPRGPLTVRTRPRCSFPSSRTGRTSRSPPASHSRTRGPTSPCTARRCRSSAWPNRSPSVTRPTTR